MRLFAALLCLSALAGCAHSAPAACKDYKPMCLLGGMESCVVNAQGCEVCTCDSTQRDGQVVPDRVSDPYSAPISRP